MHGQYTKRVIFTFAPRIASTECGRQYLPHHALCEALEYTPPQLHREPQRLTTHQDLNSIKVDQGHASARTQIATRLHILP